MVLLDNISFYLLCNSVMLNKIINENDIYGQRYRHGIPYTKYIDIRSKPLV